MSVVIETPSMAGRNKLYFSPVRWTAILAGLVGGMGAYFLLALLGVATGLTAIEPGGNQAMTRIAVGSGIFTGIVTLIGAFIGGYVSARMSGLSRTTDGLLHGFVTWAATVLLFAFLATTALSYMLGGAYRSIVPSMQNPGAVQNLTAASWWLFIGLALSLIVALIGGAAGTRAYANRVRGDRLDERRPATR